MANLFGNSSGARGYLFAASGVAAVTLLLAPFHGQINSTAIALALLLAVLIIATVFGSRPALLASLLGVLSFNFFFLPPLYTFNISDSQNWIAFGAFLVTAIIAGQLSSYARRQTEESDRVNKFTEGMVNIAKVEAGALYLQKRWSEVGEIIDNAVDRAKNRLGFNCLSIKIERELPVVLTDSNSVTEIVYTLLDNAAKYSPPASKIRITAHCAANQTTEIAVEDWGRGVAEKVRERVFDKFFRAHETVIHNTSSGLGLGLANARGIVESQGGKIWTKDERDGYKTRFAFQIPVGDD